MKKIISVCLVLLMLMSVALPVSAAESTAESAQYNGEPVVIVRGISFNGLHSIDGTPALQFDSGELFTILLESLLTRFALKDKEAFGDAFCEFAYGLFEPMSCDNEGNSKYDISMRQFHSSMASYPSYVKNLDGIAEHGLLQGAVERYGAEKVYYFTYDWRKSPRELAGELEVLIETAKKDNNSKKVDIVCASMGAMVATAYFHYCGADSVDSAVYVSGAHNGTYSFGNAINGDIYLDSDVLLSYIDNMIADNFLLQILLKVFDILGAVDYVVDFANEFIQGNFDKANDRVFRDCFGTMPGFWAICPDDCYDSGINTVFSGHESEYPVLMEKLYDTREYVFSTQKILNDVKSCGVKLTFVSNYNSGLAPVYKNADLNGDSVLETIFTSNFATVAKNGQQLTDDDIAGASAEYVSPDKVINASSAWFPEITWFVKDADHVATHYGSQYSEFVFSLLESETQVNVHSDCRYPRFMAETASGELQELK